MVSPSARRPLMRSILRLAPAAAVACALAAPAGASADTYAGSVVADGPLAYYRLSEAGGATSAATATGTATGTYVPSKTDKAAGPFAEAANAATFGAAATTE